jgi:hypothetical protein
VIILIFRFNLPLDEFTFKNQENNVQKENHSINNINKGQKIITRDSPIRSYYPDQLINKNNQFQEKPNNIDYNKFITNPRSRSKKSETVKVSTSDPDKIQEIRKNLHNFLNSNISNNKKVSNQEREREIKDKYNEYLEEGNKKFAEQKSLTSTKNYNTISHATDKILNSRVPLASKPTYNYRKHDLDKLNILTTDYLTTKMKSIKK